jgi:hypothetical protein
MKIGFTGTRHGMSFGQKDRLKRILLVEQVTEFHHGDCVGADDQADDVALELGIRVIVHPPLNDVFRAHVERKSYRKSPLIVLMEKDYILRNHDIVDSTDGLIVAPSSNEETIRSGTWATYRYAKGKKPLILLER